jgi:hypothetical protein
VRLLYVPLKYEDMWVIMKQKSVQQMFVNFASFISLNLF